MKTFNATGTASPAIVAWQSLADDPLRTVREIATAFSADRSTVRRWIKLKKLSCVRVGGQIRIRQSQALRFIREQGE
jgi:excisionase family DNA binding protein